MSGISPEKEVPSQSNANVKLMQKRHATRPTNRIICQSRCLALSELCAMRPNKAFNLTSFLSTDTKVVGPFMPGPAKPLPPDLEEFVQSSGDDGVIVVSFGTYVHLYDDHLRMLATAFSKLPQKIIFKYSPGMFHSLFVVCECRVNISTDNLD